jgi:two-component system CheB/CheR fusion protein
LVPQPAVEAPHIEEAPAQTDQRVLELEHELNSTRESLQTTIEELETSNEELKSTNEELQSTNEELQSTNEELETSKEEMQSVNEELVTVNSELQIKLDELSQANNDMTNLLASAEVGTIFLDNNLTIKRFTPSISRVINLIPSDVGRPIGHIAPNLIYDRLTQDVEEVLRTLVFKERELQTKEGNWYLMRIHPYRTLENVIEGAVITFVDISTLKHEKLFTQSALAYASQIMAIMGEPLLVLNKGLKVVTANQSYYTTFAAQPDDTIGAALIRIGNSQWNIPKLKSALDELLPLSEGSRDVEVERTLEQVGRVHARLTVRKVALPGPVNGDQEFLLLAVRSLTAG